MSEPTNNEPITEDDLELATGGAEEAGKFAEREVAPGKFSERDLGDVE